MAGSASASPPLITRARVLRALRRSGRAVGGPRCFARVGQANWPAQAGLVLLVAGALMLWWTPGWRTAVDVFSVPAVLAAANVLGRVGARRAAEGAELKVVAHLVEFFSFGGAAIVGAYGLVFWFQAHLPPS